MSRKKRIGFAVKSKYFSVYQAFRTEMEQIGYIWNEHFNEFTPQRRAATSCVYVSDDFGNYPDKPAMSFSNASANADIFDLDTNFQAAIDHATAEYARCKKSALVKLNGSYSAEVYEDRVVVGCQTIPASAVRELFRAAKKTGLITE